MKKVGIVGYGRFGELLADMCVNSFDVFVVEPDNDRHSVAVAKGLRTIMFEELANIDYIFLAVPISIFEQTVKKLSPLVNKDTVVVDICSVKIYPVQIMKKNLSNCQILATHPMFGPDSAKIGLSDMQIITCPISIEQKNLDILNSFWSSFGLENIVTTPDEHDRQTIYSLAFTHAIANVINNMDLPNITYTTRSFNAITRVAELSAKDTKQLFHDMLMYNPYLSNMQHELEKAVSKTNVTLNRIKQDQATLWP